MWCKTPCQVPLINPPGIQCYLMSGGSPWPTPRTTYFLDRSRIFSSGINPEDHRIIFDNPQRVFSPFPSI
jgi:hypothetical protein